MGSIFDAAYDSAYWLLDFLAGLLNICPFDGFISNLATSEVVQFLGWLNWFVPISDLAGLATLWAGVLITYYVVNFAVDFFKRASS